MWRKERGGVRRRQLVGVAEAEHAEVAGLRRRGVQQAASCARSRAEQVYVLGGKDGEDSCSTSSGSCAVGPSGAGLVVRLDADEVRRAGGAAALHAGVERRAPHHM